MAAPQTAADYAANPMAFDTTGWHKTGGNSTSDVWVNDQTGDVAYVGHDGRVQDVIPKAKADAFERADTPRGALDWAKGIADQANVVGTPGFGDDPEKEAAFKQLQDAANAFGGYYQQDRANSAESRGLDLDTIARLRAAEEGKTPSAAEALMRKAIDQNASQALGLAATVGGANPGMALRAGLEAQQSTGSRSAAELAALRAKEMDAARELLAGQTRTRSATDTAAAGTSGNTFAGIVAAPFEAKQREDAATQALLGSVIQGGAAVAASDIRNKTNVRPDPAMADAFLSSMSPEERTRLQVAGRAKEQGSPYVHMNGEGDAADAFLSTLKPQSFEYKNPDGKNKKAGKRIGVMAQDLPAHDVVNGPDGRKWISADVMSDVLAGVGRLHDRVKTLEGGKGGAQPQQGGAMDQPMIPHAAVHDYLASLGITSP